MLKHKRYLLKAVCFLLLLGIVLSIVTTVLKPTYLASNEWPTTQTMIDFYRMGRNTVDVLFLGSSHSVSAFSPIELYQNYGIRSYSLSCEQQNLLVSYYWLKEALRYQKPKTVILETYVIFPVWANFPMNSDGSITRKAIDFMRWSPVKLEAIRDICANDKSQDMKSYLFPAIRYHERWNRLNEEDFMPLTTQQGLLGYSAFGHGTPEADGAEHYEPYTGLESSEEAEPFPLMYTYLEKITQLCKSKGIELILTTTPTVYRSVEKHNFLNRYSTEQELRLVDFNTEELYREIGFDLMQDNNDGSHLNYHGMEKVTNYMGQLLTEEYGIVPVKDVRYEAIAPRQEAIIKEIELAEITDFDEYLEALKEPGYAVFFAVNGDGSRALSPAQREKLANLGASVDFSLMNNNSYVLCIENQRTVNEIASESLIDTVGSIRKGRVIYEVTSGGANAGNTASIIIDNLNYSKDAQGMNIVVYSLTRKKVIDSVCFDTSENFTITR